jgi:hypothetical protein
LYLSLDGQWSMVGGELGLILLNTFPTVVVAVYVRWSNQAFHNYFYGTKGGSVGLSRTCHHHPLFPSFSASIRTYLGG